MKKHGIASLSVACAEKDLRRSIKGQLPLYIVKQPGLEERILH
jgi:hypothetical protein